MTIRRFFKWYFIAPVALAGFALFIAIGGWIVMRLWNWLLPPLFGLSSITFWQALGLLALSRILFGGFGFGGGGHSKPMPREDRERIRQRMRERFCHTSEGSQESMTSADPSSTLK
jgi:hypothetical protein